MIQAHKAALLCFLERVIAKISCKMTQRVTKMFPIVRELGKRLLLCFLNQLSEKSAFPLIDQRCVGQRSRLPICIMCSTVHNSKAWQTAWPLYRYSTLSTSDWTNSGCRHGHDCYVWNPVCNSKAWQTAGPLCR